MNIAKKASKIVCVGRNYFKHAKELQNKTPSKPFFFLKPPSSGLAPNSGPILVPRGMTVHHEVELALIIGRTLCDETLSTLAAAVDALKGYALAIDLTARNLQDEVKAQGLPWTMSKGYDTFLPISTEISKTEIPNPDRVQLDLAVNGVTRQSESTQEMIFKIPQLLTAINSCMTLEPGDIVLTGTPSGVGPIKPGDEILARLQLFGDPKCTMRFQVAERESHKH